MRATTAGSAPVTGWDVAPIPQSAPPEPDEPEHITEEPPGGVPTVDAAPPPAEAVGTPTVAVFSNANLADVAPLSRVWHRIAVSWASRCAVCGRPVQQACDHDATALADVAVDDVRELAEDLWSQPGHLNRRPMCLPDASERRKEAHVPASPTEAA